MYLVVVESQLTSLYLLGRKLHRLSAKYLWTRLDASWKKLSNLRSRKGKKRLSTCVLIVISEDTNKEQQCNRYNQQRFSCQVFCYLVHYTRCGAEK